MRCAVPPCVLAAINCVVATTSPSLLQAPPAPRRARSSSADAAVSSMEIAPRDLRRNALASASPRRSPPVRTRVLSRRPIDRHAHALAPLISIENIATGRPLPRRRARDVDLIAVCPSGRLRDDTSRRLQPEVSLVQIEIRRQPPSRRTGFACRHVVRSSPSRAGWISTKPCLPRLPDSATRRRAIVSVQSGRCRVAGTSADLGDPPLTGSQSPKQLRDRAPHSA